MRTYVKDYITDKEVRQWKNGERIMIATQTGSGKTQWVKDVLYEIAKKQNKKILLLSNRKALRNQNINDIGQEKQDIITIKNYQAYETSVINFDTKIHEIIKNYDYICFDECHYFFSDGIFSRNTDVLMSMIKSPSDKSVYIYLTATPDVLYTYFHKNKFDHVYEMPYDYGFINNIYFYKKNETVENIISGLPLDEKAIYFGNATNAFELSMRVPDSTFICSESNKEFYTKSSKTTIKEIETESDFRSKALFSTKVLDSGISIINNNLKHIFIDMMDIISFEQCLGRKRIVDNNDTINLYIRSFHNGEIYFQLDLLNKRMKLVSEFLRLGKEQFQKEYARREFDNIIQNDFTINQAKLIYTKYYQSILGKIIQDHTNQDITSTPEINTPYERYITKHLKRDIKITKSAEQTFEKKSLESILESMLDKKIYKGDEQEYFKQIFFENIFSPKRKINYRSRGLHSINSILEEDNVGYTIVSRRDEIKKIRRTYWKIIKLDNVNKPI